MSGWRTPGRERMKAPASRCELAPGPERSRNQRAPITAMLCGRIAGISVTGSLQACCT